MVVAIEFQQASGLKQVTHYKLYCGDGDANVVTGIVKRCAQRARRVVESGRAGDAV